MLYSHPDAELAWDLGLRWGGPDAQGTILKEALPHRCWPCTCRTLSMSTSLNVVSQVPCWPLHGVALLIQINSLDWVGKGVGEVTAKGKGRGSSFTYWLTRIIKGDSSLPARDKTGNPWEIGHKFKMQILGTHFIQKPIIWAVRISNTWYNNWYLQFKTKLYYIPWTWFLKARGNVTF